MRDLSNLTFEQALKEMETLIHLLEDGKTTLDQAIDAYECGVKLKNHCEEQLAKARARVSQIIPSRDGSVHLHPLEVMPGEGSA